jgi:hypothetical protein
MKRLFALTLMLAAPAIALAQAAPTGQTSAGKGTTSNTAASKKTTPKATTTQTAAAKKTTSSRTQLHSAALQVAAGVSAADAALSPDELALAQQVYVGRIPCELGAFVNVVADETTPGFFRVEGKGFKYRMSPVVTTTGALRLEDPKGGAIWLQVANKSMLMNQKIGQRLADECMSPEQRVVADAMKKAPPSNALGLNRIPQ